MPLRFNRLFVHRMKHNWTTFPQLLYDFFFTSKYENICSFDAESSQRCLSIVAKKYIVAICMKNILPWIYLAHCGVNISVKGKENEDLCPMISGNWDNLICFPTSVPLSLITTRASNRISKHTDRKTPMSFNTYGPSASENDCVSYVTFC